MVYELKDTERAGALFEGWQETMLLSCFQGVMGRVFVTDTEKPLSALASVGCFSFFAGVPSEALVRHRMHGFRILVPQNEAWETMIADCFAHAKRVVRYAIRKDTVFDRERLRMVADRLPQGYQLKEIDSGLYDRCLENPVTADFVSAFESKEKYLENGRGMVILKNGRIVSGASSYSRYREGIEIEVNTVIPERRKHLATAACAALILRCLEEGLYPSWDAQNLNSVRLAEKLGYRFSHEYPAFEVKTDD